MTDEQIERVANALARVSSELDPTKPAPAVSEHHRKLARVAIQTLDGLRLKAALRHPGSDEQNIGTSYGAASDKS
jgi:hypothetical protein